MKREVRQLFIFNQAEKQALIRLSKIQQVSQSELVRTLLRDSAKQAGIWPGVKGGSKNVRNKNA